MDKITLDYLAFSSTNEEEAKNIVYISMLHTLAMHT